MKQFFFVARTLLMVVVPATAEAATLTTVPMQGGMIMPMLAYHSSDGGLNVTVPVTVPQLTPLLVSNLGDSFDPADPWYAYLDPSQQGLAFSRRYGFVVDTMSDPLPYGTAIWIRKLSGSTALGIFRYRSNIPKLWEPIFGTAGVTNALQWDLNMFHPGITAPPGIGTLAATFEAFLLNTADGSPVAGANTGPFTLNWTVGPDGRPTLTIDPNLVVRWPASATNYVLESADTLTVATWTPVTNTPMVVDGQMAVAVESNTPTRFFRMRLAP